MEEQLVTFETAKLAKEKGFHWKAKCYHSDGTFQNRDQLTNYNNKMFVHGDEYLISAPTQSLLQKWLREVHNLNVWVSSKTTDKGNTIFIPHGRTIPDTIKKGLVKDVIAYKTFDNNEEALEFGLQEALKLIE
jgi:hypothetical protein